MVTHIKNHRNEIQIEIDGRSISLVTVGYVAHVLRRTTTCLRQWEVAGLFPPAPYRLTKGQLRLYPTDFLKALDQIQQDGHLGKRLDKSDWRRFQLAFWNALDLALVPMSEPNGVTDGDSDEACQDVARHERLS